MNRLPLAACLLLIASCKSPRQQQNTDSGVPTALEDKGSSYEIVSKRGYQDMVEGLYAELAEKTPELKRLEESLAALREGKSDSLTLFHKYGGKNQSYYDAANNHVQQVKDTALRERLKTLVTASLLRYKAVSAKHDGLLNLIGKEEASLNDLHQALKITRTLPLMEAFQKGSLPSPAPLQRFADGLSATLRYADSLTKK